MNFVINVGNAIILAVLFNNSSKETAFQYLNLLNTYSTVCEARCSVSRVKKKSLPNVAQTAALLAVFFNSYLVPC